MLFDCGFSYHSIRMLTSRRFVGHHLFLENRESMTALLRNYPRLKSFDGVDVTLFSDDGSASCEFNLVAAERGAFVVVLPLFTLSLSHHCIRRQRWFEWLLTKREISNYVRGLLP